MFSLGFVALFTILFILVFGTVAIMYNMLVGARNKANNAWFQISVQLKRRRDLIPNLVEAVRGYMQYEKETLESVIQARTRAIAANTIKETSKAEGELSTALGRLIALFERYPELKANENVLRLQEQLVTTENQLSFSRQFFNDCVMELNNLIQKFPTNIIAAIFNFKPMDYFEIPSEEKEVPKVDLKL